MPDFELTLDERLLGKYRRGREMLLTIGRERNNDIVIPDPNVSRKHAKIVSFGGRYLLTDLRSKNGTFVNKARVATQWLEHGDVVRIGKHQVTFLWSDEELLAGMELNRGKKAGTLNSIIENQDTVMTTQKVRPAEKDSATLTCMGCGRSKAIDASGVNNINIPRRVTCSCGGTYQVAFDRRREFRKEVHILGKYLKTGSMTSEVIMIKDLSHNGLKFRVISKDRNGSEEIPDLERGDILHIEFRLDNGEKSTLCVKAIVRHNHKGYIGAVFCAPDEHTKRQLSIYTQP